MSVIKSFIQSISKSDVLKIIVITTLFYVIVSFTKVTYLISNESTQFFDENIWKKIGLFSLFSLELKQIWSLVSFCFIEENAGILLSNMVWLWVFGIVLENQKGFYQVIPVYIMGGLLGAICFLIYGNLVVAEGNLFFYIGTMPSITAVAVASVLYNPTYVFFQTQKIKIPIWILGIVFVALQIIANDFSKIYLIALFLGGVLAGIFYNYLGGAFFDRCTKWLQKFERFFGNNNNFMSHNKK